MAEQHSPIIDFPRKYIGRRLGDLFRDKAEHFYRCPACGRRVDCATLTKCSTMRGRHRIPPKIGANNI